MEQLRALELCRAKELRAALELCRAKAHRKAQFVFHEETFSEFAGDFYFQISKFNNSSASVNLQMERSNI